MKPDEGKTPAISIKGLNFAYPSVAAGQKMVQILKGIDLEIAQGEFVSIMGPTGAGKTTLCLALNGIIPHSTGGRIGGNVEIFGKNTKEYKTKDLAKHVGIVFQDPETQLFTMSVEDEVAFALECLSIEKSEMEDRITEAMRYVGIEQLRKRSPMHLSGGQKQRVAIAAILAMDPEIIILDEPTSGLDPIGTREVFRVVDELRSRSDKTIIMVEHESEQIARFSDRVIVLEDGILTMEGSPREIFSAVEELKNAGVSIPQVTELAYAVRNSADRPLPIILDEAIPWFSRNP